MLERHYRSIQGVADDSGFGGTTMQYQVLLDPNKLFAYGVTVPTVTQQLGNNNANAGGGFYSQGGQFYYIRGLGLVRNKEDIGNIVLQEKNGIPIYVKDIAQVEIGYAPRLGQFGFNKQDEAVEGVILMRVGEQAQVILKRVEAMTNELNEHVLPPDVKVVPYYDRSGLIDETTKTVEANLLRGMVLVLVILGIFLFSARTALIVAVTFPFALMFSFICLDWRHIPANLLSIGAIDFGIIVDGAVVMVENIFRELAAQHGQDRNVVAVIRAAAADVERPIFYAIAVIIAGYLPIYVLSGPSGRLFQPTADTMSFALLGSLLCALTLLPVLCSYFLRKRMHEPQVRIYEWIRRQYGRVLGWCLRNRLVTVMLILAVFGCSLLLIPFIGGEFMPHLDEGAIWVRATTPYTISFEEASKLSPQIRDILRSFPQASFIYRENNERYIGVQFSVEGRDLASAVGEARKTVESRVKLPLDYRFDWGGEYKDYLASQQQMKIILPLTVLLILLILFALYGNLKFPVIIFFSVLVTEPVGGLLALYLTHTNFSVSSLLGFGALMGVAVQTSVILYSFINKLRLEGSDIVTATFDASLLRLRPIMMTALVACFGLLPAAMSTGIGSDSQKPFAIVIVGGLASRLLLSIFLSPVLYTLAAREGDVLQV